MKEKSAALNRNKIKALLTVSAIIEAGTGLVLMVIPQLLTMLLFGTKVDSLVALTVARVAGVAVFSLAVACWFARNDGLSNAARGLVSAMLVYNLLIVLVLVITATGITLPGIGLWPVVLLHTALSAYCLICLLK